MKFDLKPNLGAGDILLGMTEQEVHAILGNDFEKVNKSVSDEFETDMYEWCFVYYKSPGVCEAIEFFEPAVPLLGGERLIGRPYTEVKGLFLKLDSLVQFDDAGLTSFNLGIGVYAPSAEKDPDEPVEGVIVFEKGYYD